MPETETILCTAKASYLGFTYTCDSPIEHRGPRTLGGTPHTNRVAEIVWDDLGEVRPVSAEKAPATSVAMERVQAFLDQYETSHGDVIMGIEVPEASSSLVKTEYRLLANDIRALLAEIERVKNTPLPMRRRGRGRRW